MLIWLLISAIAVGVVLAITLITNEIPSSIESGENSEVGDPSQNAFAQDT